MEEYYELSADEITERYTRECLAIEVDTSLPSGRVIRVLEQLQKDRGLPKQLRLDNGRN